MLEHSKVRAEAETGNMIRPNPGGGLSTFQPRRCLTDWADDVRRVLVEELVEWVTVFPDHLEVTVAGASSPNVLYGEVELKGSIVGVGESTQ